MKIRLVAIGRNAPQWIVEGFCEYSKRLPKQMSLELREIATAKRSGQKGLQQILEEEGAKMLDAIAPDDLVIALDERGAMWNTLDLAAKLQNCLNINQNISLLVGGPDGLHPDCKKRSHIIWSLSPLTLPHALVRVIVAEQIYRAWSILQHHPYHRGS